MSVVRHIAFKIGIRILVLAGIAFISNEIYKAYFWKKDLDRDAEMLLELLNIQDSSDILYFGESSNFSYNPEKDSLQDRISDFISYHYPELSLGTLNSSAYHAGIYLPLVKQISSNSVKTIIVTMNLRTFDQAAIHSELESALQKKACMYEPRPPLLNRLLMSLKFYDHTSAVERDRKMWEEWTYDTLRSDSVEFPAPTIKRWCELPKFLDSSGKEDMARRQLADHYIKAYAFTLTEENSRIKDFDEIARIATEKGIRVVFNLLAENVEYAQEYVGDNLVWLMRRNAAFLANRYRSPDVMVVNNLELVPGYDYTDQNWTTEHYGQYGRQKIAQNVAQQMQHWYPGLFVPQKIR